MKNIHILQKNVLNQLGVDHYGKTPTQIKIEEYLINKNTYITSDEEIKEGDWVIYTKGIIHCQKMDYKEDLLNIEEFDAKKIILTIDQDLIEDGVQAIDDEFLEWFVNNPSCEFVKVKPFCEKLTCQNEDCSVCCQELKYKIIIPKEEVKQETLEEVAERLFPTNTNDETINYQNTVRKPNWLQGAKWQQERMYSKEEVDRILRNFRTDFLPFGQVNDFALNNWFKKFKKK